MKGGVILFRGNGTAARRYLESDRAQADEYYLEAGTALAEFSVLDNDGEVVGEGVLDPEQYAAWVDWINPLTGESMGTPREPGEGRQGSPRFAEMVINTPKSLSVAAALHPEVSEALDVAQKHAMDQMRAWLGQHSVTRVGPRGKQEVVPVEQLETVSVVHRTSRAGDPHRHIHFQIGTRVWAASKWRGLDTAALFKQQGALRALGTAVLAAHPQLAETLHEHGLTLDPVTGEVTELVPFNDQMSKRAVQVRKNLTRMEAEWEEGHPGQEPGPVVRSKLVAMAWDHERPAKKPSQLSTEAGWRRELRDAGYTPETPQTAHPPAVSLDDLRVQEVANRALDRCAASASTWTRHMVQEQATRIVTEAGVRAEPDAITEFVTSATRLATEDCLSVLPPDAPQVDHVAHLTSVQVIRVETELRDLLEARVTGRTHEAPDVSKLAEQHGLDAGQVEAAAAVASADPLVVIEGAAGAGKTTMLGAAIAAAQQDRRRMRVVAPTKKAADVAAKELGVPADSVAKLVHAHGWRWNRDGVWTRLAPGNVDPETGETYTGPPENARLQPGERVVVDEAGMLDQDTALALLTVAAETGATVALVGDRAQLPAVGRGGVLDMAAQITGATIDMTGVHRFTDPDYADLTVQMRTGSNPALVFDRLNDLGLIHLHDTEETAREYIAAATAGEGAITVATNDEARALNERIRETRVQSGVVDDARTVTGSDGLDIGAGDLVQTRKNDSTLKVANRQTWIVQHVEDDGTVWAKETGTGRKHQHTVTLPAEYVTQQAHLAYASTAYGVQGATVAEADTLLSDGLSAAGLYVGMTRGQNQNRLHIVAEGLDEARGEFTAAMERDRADRGLATATHTAGAAVAGLTDDGPVKLVNTERAHLRKRIAKAEGEVDKWQQAIEAFTEQRETHRAEQEEHEGGVAAAESHAEQVRAEVTEPLIEQATVDGNEYLTARSALGEAETAHRSAGRLKKRTTARTLDEAGTEHRTVEQSVRERWGSLPQTTTNVQAWAQAVAQQHADVDLRVVDADQQAENARTGKRELSERHRAERAGLSRRYFTRDPIGTHPGQERAQVELDRWQHRADNLRRDLGDIERLPINEAAELVSQRRAKAQARRQAAERARSRSQSQLTDTDLGPTRRPPPRPRPSRDGIGM
ncbi:MobF family relaxase [Nesterenkonia alkaliphila]|nr:MobF family relaxase [Nesterenkonia alkaliphila]GFZ88720.1 hypothetical protein GCM10011359_17620 [Nesterenkonia alkaliphila]